MGLAQGVGTPQPSSRAAPGTGSTPAVAPLLALRSSVHWNATVPLSWAEKRKVALRMLTLALARVTTGGVASTLNSCVLVSWYPATSALDKSYTLHICKLQTTTDHVL